ncbi:hypothetical protein [Nocardioides houyundeii]|uniref:hypothetical protein n=1 Tax=Nocardioides houyundeii TaxID=2045452 RepID=UPI000C78B0DF|nr:hypothetical protein [Nocardioides houyundeii]
MVFTSNARQVAARNEALAAKHEAGDAFIALDLVQKDVAMLVTAFAGLDAGPDGLRVQRSFEPLERAGNQAAQAWIDALDAHDASLEDDRAEVRALREAQTAFRAAYAALSAAQRDLQQFAEKHRDVEAQVRKVWGQVAPRTAAARQALTEARDAVARVRAAGLSSPALDQRLAGAEQAARPVLDGGAHKHGATATIEAAARAVDAAQEVVRAADELAGLATDTPRRLSTTRTRLDAVSVRLDAAEPLLSVLRREFSLACSADLDDVPARGRALVAEAADLLASANRHAAAQHWEAAAADLAACRERLAEAETGLTAVRRRVDDLKDVAEDPARAKARTRFAVRDAQRLVVASGSRVPAREAGILDNLAARLDAADQLLDATKPDYWGYLKELRAIDQLTDDVVRRCREAISSQA